MADLESNLVFHDDDFEMVAEIVGAWKRRKSSEEQRQVQVDRLQRRRQTEDDTSLETAS